MPNFESFLPSDEWQSSGVHWHAFADIGGSGALSRAGEREARLAASPHAVLRSPWEVARWIDGQTRAHGEHRKVWSAGERRWAEIGDEDDLDHLRQENYGIASRGDSIYTDVYSETEHHNLYVEAVTDEQCQHECTSNKPH